jgi:iduronate 2-sulfatase
LCGLPPVGGLHGESLVPLLNNPQAPGKAAVLTQHPRPYFNGELTQMGYALRTPRYRYVEWRERSSDAVVARELYDHASDPKETVNRAADPALAGLVERLAAQTRELVGPQPKHQPLSAN